MDSDAVILGSEGRPGGFSVALWVGFALFTLAVTLAILIADPTQVGAWLSLFVPVLFGVLALRERAAWVKGRHLDQHGVDSVGTVTGVEWTGEDQASGHRRVLNIKVEFQLEDGTTHVAGTRTAVPVLTVPLIQPGTRVFVCQPM